MITKYTGPGLSCWLLELTGFDKLTPEEAEKQAKKEAIELGLKASGIELSTYCARMCAEKGSKNHLVTVEL